MTIKGRKVRLEKKKKTFDEIELSKISTKKKKKVSQIAKLADKR